MSEKELTSDFVAKLWQEVLEQAETDASGVTSLADETDCKDALRWFTDGRYECLLKGMLLRDVEIEKAIVRKLERIRQNLENRNDDLQRKNFELERERRRHQQWIRRHRQKIQEMRDEFDRLQRATKKRREVGGADRRATS